MQEMWHEWVIEGPHPVIKGFISGVLLSEGLDLGAVLFPSDLPIRAESLFHLVGEWAHLVPSVSHLLVPHDVHGILRPLLARAEPIGLKLRKERPIRSASFHFSYAVYNQELFNQIQSEFASTEGLSFSEGYEPVQEADAESSGTELYSPTHHYVGKAEGVVLGEFSTILGLHHRLEKYPQCKLHRIELHHADD
jgi:hypothetical protein